MLKRSPIGPRRFGESLALFAGRSRCWAVAPSGGSNDRKQSLKQTLQIVSPKPLRSIIVARASLTQRNARRSLLGKQLENRSSSRTWLDGTPRGKHLSKIIGALAHLHSGTIRMSSEGRTYVSRFALSPCTR